MATVSALVARNMQKRQSQGWQGWRNLNQHQTVIVDRKMTWTVESLGENGSVAERLCNNESEVANVLQEFRGKGSTAWVEDDQGHEPSDELVPK
jgi:hypothetical protein